MSLSHTYTSAPLGRGETVIDLQLLEADIKTGRFQPNILQIAKSLSRQCRYNGHGSKFYSVAEHSLLLSMCVPRDLRVAALLHDAGEAITGDITCPMQAFLGTEAKAKLRSIGGLIAKASCEYYGHLAPEETVKKLDRQILLNEKRDLFPDDRLSWSVEGLPVKGVKIRGLSPAFAERAFLKRFEGIV